MISSDAIPRCHLRLKNAGLAFALIAATILAIEFVAAPGGDKTPAPLGRGREALAGPATVARLPRGSAKGARGTPIADLTITKAASGTLSGSVDLTQEQVDSLRQGKLYLQIHSAKGVAPDGSNLWGWFLK